MRFRRGKDKGLLIIPQRLLVQRTCNMLLDLKITEKCGSDRLSRGQYYSSIEQVEDTVSVRWII